MIDSDFCDMLEYRIWEVLKNSDIEAQKGFWCDGVLPPFNDNELSKKYVNDNRQVTLRAFIGPDGQNEYELQLVFGPKALSRYARGLDIVECIPVGGDNWFEVDPLSRAVSVRLL